MSRDENKPLVSVLMLAYNHNPYISQAIESVLSQQTRHPFELIVCDDASSDGTREIAKSWAEKDPRIVLSFQERNTNFTKNFTDGCNLIRGKYLAFCEGDDYWTDLLKMEKQASFLEANPDFSVCAHRVQVMNAGEEKLANPPKYIYKDCSADEMRVKDGVFYADESIANYYFQTGSMMLRWRFHGGFPHWFRKTMMFDHYLFLLHAVEGKIKYFDEPMSVWRRHNGGYTWLQTQDKGLFFQKKGKDWIQVYKEMNDFFSNRFDCQIKERINLALRSMAQNCFETGNMDNLRSLVASYKGYFENVMRNEAMVDAYRMVFPKWPEFEPPWTLQASTENQGGADNAEQTGKELQAASDNSLMGSQFLGIEEIPVCEDSVWSKWSDGCETGEYFNLRSALCAWNWQNGITRVWLPAYGPPALVKMFSKYNFEFFFYPVSGTLEQDCGFISQVRRGDAILAIEYLGKPLPDQFCKAMAARRDIHWLIDRAQSLSTKKYDGAEAYFYSPPKLFGMLEGCVVAKPANSQGKIASPGAGTGLGEDEKSFLQAGEKSSPETAKANRLARLKWGEEHQVSQKPMSRLTKLMLERIPYEFVSERRKANWKTLFSRLGSFCLWDAPEPDFAPWAFPFLCPLNLTCEAMHTLLERKNIACQRMWHPLKVPAACATAEAELAKRLLLLPVDSRLNSENMERIIESVEEILAMDSMRVAESQIF